MRLSSKVSAFGMVVLALSASPGLAQQTVPFQGTWVGITTAADLSNFPLVGVVAAGGGTFSHLGRSTMVSPHTTNVFTGETLGDQVFTAANGDELTAYCSGFPLPGEDGTVTGTLDCLITSGTGRFEGAAGTYTFSLVATPREGEIGYATTAEVEGAITTVGSRRRSGM